MSKKGVYGGFMSQTDMRQAIKTTALELLVRHGYRGTSFGDIAAERATTRANIHYHFGGKQALVEEVLGDYVQAMLAALRSIWIADNLSLGGKIEAMVGHSRMRFHHFNVDGKEVRPWSLISRLRPDADLLSPEGRGMLDHFGSELAVIIADALAMAGSRGELANNVQADEAALLLAAIADNAAAITLTQGGFGRLETIYSSLQRLIEQHAEKNT
jgi:TetR/AcrR family transcriptional regulator, transcriptional repressor for nem operon